MINLNDLLYGNGNYTTSRSSYGNTQKWVPVSHYETNPDGSRKASAGSVIGQQRALADLYENRARGIQSGFDSGMMDERNLYRASEGMARQFGQGGEALIDQDTARAIKAANQVAGASLAARGFGGSTMLANQQSQNQINATREGSKAKVGLRQQALDRVLGVRGQAAASQNQNNSRRADLQGNLLNNTMLYRQQPIQTQLNTQMSGVMNPFLGANTTQYFPGVSPEGSALATAGNALGLYGGYQMANGSGGGGSSSNPYGLYGGGQMNQMRQSYGG